MRPGLIIRRGAKGVDILPPSPLPIAAMMLGRTEAEAIDLLPRIFNLCRGAQVMALRLALGQQPGDLSALRAEILRDHQAKLAVIWPGLLGLPLRPMQAEVWGGPVPRDLGEWLTSGQGAAPVLNAIAQAFAPNEAASLLPLATAQSILAGGAQENSVAARQAAHPLMQQAEARWGRGPLWQALARVIEADALSKGDLPAPVVLADGTAVVPAARGAYAVRARSRAGVVTHFERCTPTDHLCAPKGGLMQALASLAPQNQHLAPLVVDILSPCVPVVFEEVADA